MNPRTAALTLFLLLPALPAQMASAPPSTETVPATPGILTREAAGALMPVSVFFHGRSAPTQARNSSGLRTPDGKLVLIADVDTSGYSTAIQQSYQAYLITEIPLRIGSTTLAAGAYGLGFAGENQFVAMDLGGTELLRIPTQHDASLRRPTPVQVLQDATPGTYRLYFGRTFIAFTPK